MNEVITVAEGQFEKMATGITSVCSQALDLAPKLVFDVKKIPECKAAYLEADRLLSEINRAYNHVEEKRKELTKPLDEVKAKIMEAAKQKTGPLLAMKELLRRSMSIFSTAEENWAAAERRKQEEAERKRKEDERLATAQLISDAGRPKAADEILDKPINVRPAYVPTANNEAASTRRKVWNVEITDPKAFVKAWLEGKAPSGAITIDAMMLKRVAAAQKGQIDWPGVRAFEEIVIGSGR